MWLVGRHRNLWCILHFNGVVASPLSTAGGALQDAHERQPPPNKDGDGTSAAALSSAALAGPSTAAFKLSVDAAVAAAEASLEAEVGRAEEGAVEVADDAAFVETERLALGRKAEKLGRPRPSEARLLPPWSTDAPL